MRCFPGVFDSDNALYSLTATMHSMHFDDADPLAEEFRQFLASPQFPCVGAKSALAKRQIKFLVCRDIRSAWDDLRIYGGLFKFVELYRSKGELFQSFVVLFREPKSLTEGEYEALLWERIQSLTDKDGWHGQPHDARVSANPADPHFSISFAKEAFFAVGLHPNASRPARRFSTPAIVFNPHEQFEELRKQNHYATLREKIMI